MVNQHLKLLALLTVGIHLKVDAVIVPAVASRVLAEAGRARWQAEAPGTLWDMTSIDKLLDKHGVKMIGARSHRIPAGAVYLPNYYFRATDISVVAEDIRRICREKSAAAGIKPTNITLFAPDLILSLRTADLKLYAEVAAAVRFAPQLLHLADIITTHMLTLAPRFAGLHLRIRGEAHSNPTNASVASELSRYHALIQAQPVAASPMYVVSGIFSETGEVAPPLYGVVEAWLRDQVVARGHASKVVNRHLMLVGKNDTLAAAKLHSEQRTAVDFLVLLKAERVFGSRTSTFSYVLQETRALRGIPRGTMHIVGSPWWLLPIAAKVAVGV